MLRPLYVSVTSVGPRMAVFRWEGGFLGGGFLLLEVLVSDGRGYKAKGH